MWQRYLDMAYFLQLPQCIFNKRKIITMVDLKNTYVRVTKVIDDKYIEFDFAIEHQELFVELVLPPAMFKVFCEKNNVTILEGEREPDKQFEEYEHRMSDVRNTSL